MGARCRSLQHGLRHLLARTTTPTGTVGLGQQTSAFGRGFAAWDAEVASSSSSLYSALCWQETGQDFRLPERRNSPPQEVRWIAPPSREVGWSAWSHLVVPSRGVHGTPRMADGEDEESRGVGMKEEGREPQPKVTNEEARKLVQQVHLVSLKKRLRDDPRDTISSEDLLEICKTVGMASSDEEAKKMANDFDRTGVVLTFRGKVHVHPEKIAELVANVLPLSLLGEDDQRRMELAALAKKKEEIDRKAHKQMRLVLWAGLCGLTVQMLVFFRLTFWELSWDVMEPIAFFATTAGIICGYTYFMVTSRDPSYRDFMQRIYHSRQRKLFRKQNFDIKRYKELRTQCEAGWKPTTKRLLEDAD